ncbi:hypothetical protein KP509_01G077300 [Ceratopteris richardii]|uniref:Uncharacterized protein n=1 Tax=Ceratopteris richardii TaxID=49495 RepID=A0A8T2VIA5_CERRI|nr:hypothetical protein KP509_01G077300 [Ceratopteris richardii]
MAFSLRLRQAESIILFGLFCAGASLYTFKKRMSCIFSFHMSKSFPSILCISKWLFISEEEVAIFPSNWISKRRNILKMIKICETQNLTFFSQKSQKLISPHNNNFLLF